MWITRLFHGKFLKKAFFALICDVFIFSILISALCKDKMRFSAKIHIKLGAAS